MSIKTRLILVFATFFTFMIAILFYAVLRMADVGQTTEKIANDRIPKVAALSEISKQVNIIARAARNMYIFRETAQVNEEKNEILRAREIIGQKLDYLKPLIKNPKAIEILSDINIVRSEFIKTQDKFISVIEKDNKEEAYNLLISEFRPIQLKYIALLDKLQDYQIKISQEESRGALDLISTVTRNISIVSILSLLLLGFVGFVLIRSIINPILSLDKSVFEIGQEGNFNAKIEVHGED